VSSRKSGTQVAPASSTRRGHEHGVDEGDQSVALAVVVEQVAQPWWLLVVPTGSSNHVGLNATVGLAAGLTTRPIAVASWRTSRGSPRWSRRHHDRRGDARFRHATSHDVREDHYGDGALAAH